MQNIFSTNIPIPTENDIDIFERKHQVNLPKDYKQFMLTFGGGRVSENFDNFESSKKSSDLPIDNMFSFIENDEVSTLEKEIETYKTTGWSIGNKDYELPSGLLPIGDDCFGNYYYMGIHKQNHGKIYWWSHDGDGVKGYKETSMNVYYLSSSFSNFISKLKKYEE